MRSLLDSLVAAAPGDLVLPGGDRRAQVEVSTPLTLLDAHDLGSGRWIGVVLDADGGRWTVPLALDDAGLRRAVPGDGVAEALVRALGDGDTFAGHTRFSARSWHVEDVQGERAITADQTNESVVVGERAVVKWSVRLPRAGVTGAQPAGERLETLMGQGFTGTPRPWGLLRYVDQESGPALLLATIAELLPGAQDGWDWAVDDVRALARGDIDLDSALAPSKRLGTLTASMHVALASQGHPGADDALVSRWESRAGADLAEAMRLVDGDEGIRLRDRATRIVAAFEAFRAAVGTPLIDVHGDLHVGQVLRFGDPHDYAVTDFDGNPVLEPQERAAPQPAALDVAGMLASLDHVGRVVIERTDDLEAGAVHGWIAAAQDAFLHAYQDTLERMGSRDLLDDRLLVPLRLQQEIREYLYAVKHLPHWRYVPDAALIDLLPDEE